MNYKARLSAFQIWSIAQKNTRFASWMQRSEENAVEENASTSKHA